MRTGSAYGSASWLPIITVRKQTLCMLLSEPTIIHSVAKPIHWASPYFCFICMVWFFTSQSTSFHLCQDGSWTSTKWIKCLAQWHITVTPPPMRLESTTPSDPQPIALPTEPLISAPILIMRLVSILWFKIADRFNLSYIARCYVFLWPCSLAVPVLAGWVYAFCGSVQELPKAQPAVVLVLKRLRRRGNGLKSHPTDWEKPDIEPATPGLQDIGLSPTPRCYVDVG